MIPQQIFGRSGHASTRLIFGSWALSQASPIEAESILSMLLEYGVNHIDTAAMYGMAEERIGLWMKKHRDAFFLATKTRSRQYEGAWKDLRHSLELLGVDHVDLWQMHGLTNPVGWERAMGPDGTLKAFLEARDQGLVRFLGVTGHGGKVPAVHQRSLERYDFDSVLLPYNYCQMQNPRYAKDFNDLLEICRQRQVAVQTIKAVARRSWGNQVKTHNTYFYQPLVTPDAVRLSIHWAMGLEDAFVISAGDIQLLPLILEAASSYHEPPSDDEMRALMEQYEIQPIFSY